MEENEDSWESTLCEPKEEFVKDETNLCETDNKFLVTETINKLANILWKLLEPNFEVKNDLYLNLLLAHWINKTENGVMTPNLNQESNELFFQWLVAATNLWDEKKITPSTPVLIFALHVCCQLNTDEQFFNQMQNEKVFYKLTEISQADQGFDTGVTVGFITLLSSILDYATGVEWLLTTTYWNYIINIALKGRTKYIKRKAYQFIIKLLETTILLDQEFCEELVAMLVYPFSDAAEKVELTKESEVKNTQMYETLKPSLELVSEVANSLLKSFNKNVLNFFLDMEMPEQIQNILDFSKSEDFCFDLLKIRFAFLFYQLCVKMEGLQQATHDEETLADIKVMFELIRAEIEKDNVSCVLKICHYAHTLYCSLDTRIPLCVRKGESIEFQNQMMLIQLVPAMAFSYQLIGTKECKNLVRTDDLRRDFYLKFAKISAIKTLEITSRWQTRLAHNGNLVCFVSLSLQYILKSKKLINKEQAAFIFKPLIYILKDVAWRMEAFSKISMRPRGIEFLTTIVNTIVDLVESFDLTWKDSIETIMVLDLACEINQYDYVDYQVSLKFLELLNIAISRCMSPNMVLLMDNTSDSSISQVGDILYSKCHNQNHKIRSTALEVVRTLALNASAKFPEFTNILFNAKLPQLVVEMALNDRDHVVRANALKCIQELILVEDIWETYQSDHNFWDNIPMILLKEPNGPVRKEAAQLVYDIYKDRSIPEELLPRIYDTMTHAAIADIRWEVKCKAISFWACTLRNHLQAQGMADRRFPTHVFSREKKKIITLTEVEIRKRVVKVLNQLSEIGCLYVLKTAVQDEFDEEVSKKALFLVKQMVRMFEYHKITCDNIGFIHSPSGSSLSSRSSSSTPKSEHSKSSRETPFGLNSPQMEYSDSPSSTELSFSPPPASPEDISQPSPGYWSPASPNTQKIQKQENQTSDFAYEELDNFDLLNDAYTEKDLLMLDNDFDMGIASTEKTVDNAIGSDMAETEKMFDELLKLNDATLLEQICKPGNQVKTKPKLKTKEYVPPSEYVRFCYEFVESSERKSLELKHDVDEFDSVLDDLIKEYGVTNKDRTEI